jgi:hypothetical protein
MEVPMTSFGAGYSGGNSGNAVGDAARAQSAAREANEKARDANVRMDQLLLVCTAMWVLLRERAKLTEDDLIAKVAEIDARDGTADGKMTHGPRKCAGCQRTILGKHRKCMYCGAPVILDSLFAGI